MKLSILKNLCFCFLFFFPINLFSQSEDSYSWNGGLNKPSPSLMETLQKFPLFRKLNQAPGLILNVYENQKNEGIVFTTGDYGRDSSFEGIRVPKGTPLEICLTLPSNHFLKTLNSLVGGISLKQEIYHELIHVWQIYQYWISLLSGSFRS